MSSFLETWEPDYLFKTTLQFADWIHCGLTIWFNSKMAILSSLFFGGTGWVGGTPGPPHKEQCIILTNV